MGDGARALGELGDDIVHRPGVLPGKAHGWFRTWFGRLWRLRGGGLYAFGYVVSFAWLEVRSMALGLVQSEGVVDFVTSEIFEYLFRFLSDSLINFVLAFLWPAYLASVAPPFGLIALGAAFLLFPRVLKKPLERWLFGDGPPAASGN